VRTASWDYAADVIIDPGVWEQPEMRRALAARDVGAVYRGLRGVGITQREIARRTGQSQSEVSEILAGRRVKQVDVLERICDGLGIPREMLGLCYGDRATYGGEVTVADPEEVEKMLRRRLIALGGRAIAGATVAKFGELLVLQGQMYRRASLTCDDASPGVPATRHFSSI